MIDDVEDRAGGARLGIVGAVHQTPHAGQHDGAGAHGAGLQGHVERGVAKPPAAQRRGRLAQHQHLGVRGGVVAALALVAGGRDDPALDGKHRPDRDLALLAGTARLLERQGHEGPVGVHLSRTVARPRCGRAFLDPLVRPAAAAAVHEVPRVPSLRPTVK